MKVQDRRKLRSYLINKDLQLYLLRQNLVYLLIIVIVTVSILMAPLIGAMILSSDLESQYQAAQSFLKLAKWLPVSILIFFVLFAGQLILITHRICGPLVNFTHTFNKLAEGDFTRKVYLRRGDYLTHESKAINGMIDGISGIINHVLTEQKILTATLENFKSQVKDLDSEKKITLALDIIEQKAALVSETLSHFKIEDNKE